MLDEYTQSPELVKIRIYNTKLSGAIGKIGTVRVVQDGETRIFISGSR